MDAVWAAFFEGFELGRTRAGESGCDGTIRLRAVLAEFRTRGHLQARINPLVAAPEPDERISAALATLAAVDRRLMVAVEDFQGGRQMPLDEMLAELQAAYCGSIGFEIAHIRDTEVAAWLRERAESRAAESAPDPEQAAHTLRWLLEAEAFEQFLGRRFLGERRYSLEGAEGLMVALNALLEHCPRAGVEEIEMGMSHRGRVNVLANFVRKTLAAILYEFTPGYKPETDGGGDVRYHLGYENFRHLSDGRVRVSLAASPSHLEAVNAVVEGRARARQRLRENAGEADAIQRVLPLLLHGDASFAGQGSVAEVFNLSQLRGYHTGGTIHLVINNQIGFTTTTRDARTSLHATDVARAIDAPIVHVNGEDPMALQWVARFALEFRRRFARDIVIDLLCYRRHGHNEADQAGFTQPQEARSFAERPSVGQAYKAQLVAQGLLDAEEADGIEETILEKLEAGHSRMMALSARGNTTVLLGSTGVLQPPYSHEPVFTGVAPELLRQVGQALTRLPEGFTPHPALAESWLPARARALAAGGPIDWPLAEALAFGALLLEGTPVRLSGQDSRRGAFSQRHAVFYDFLTRERHIPLNHLGEGQARFTVHNSPLSQAAVLGFDYGFSQAHPEALTLWESQFGDFANNAQTVIDQFIASGEAKWGMPSGLVLLLPHGYEGMGPEHSSAWLERFLQLCAADNIIVANCTTPAQFFHLLRRQKLRLFHKPLVVMTPKTRMFRADMSSTGADFLSGTCFREMLADPEAPDPAEVVRLVLCSGGVFFDLASHRRTERVRGAALLRVEQLYPFHAELLRELAAAYPRVREVVWCQEEPENMGAWRHIAPQIESVLGLRPRYAGRPATASPAAGSRMAHLRERDELLERAFSEFPTSPSS